MFSNTFLALLPFVRVLLLSPAFASADVAPFINSVDYQDGVYGNYSIQTYITEPQFKVPVPNVVVEPQDGVSPSRHIMWTPVGYVTNGMNGNGPMMLDTTDLSLVYRAPMYTELDVAPWGRESIGATVQTCNGTQYITWWAGKGYWGRKAGRYYVLNMNYELVYNVSAVNFDYGDAHEFYLTPQCTAVFTVYQEKSRDLTQYNITDGWTIENYFQEVDLATNELLFQWNVSEHVAIDDTYLPPNITHHGYKAWAGMDYFHMNSIEKDHKGNYLISSRHMHAIYYIEGATGNILWQMGGKRNQFTDITGGNVIKFAWQHHARWTSDEMTSISLFDNRNAKYKFADDYVSRGIIFDIDTDKMEVALRSEYRAPSNITSVREGSMQLIPDTPGNVMLGWGNEPGWTEYTADGRIVWDVRFGPLDLDRATADNYRALKVNWTGVPTWAPKIAAGPTNVSLVLPLAQPLESINDTIVIKDSAYFSWNGATEVTKWIVLASSDNTTSLNATTDMWQEIPKSGFESNVFVNSTARFVRALAVAANNTILGATEMLDMQTGNITASTFNVTLFNEQMSLETARWGVAAFAMLKEKWGVARDHPHSSKALVGLSIVSLFGFAAYALLKRRKEVKYQQIRGRKRSDTLDSKIEMGLTINVVDHDGEGYNSRDSSPSSSEDRFRYRDFDGNISDFNRK